jgi:hypothetical protein
MNRAPPASPSSASAEHGARITRKALRAKAWLLGALVLALYVGFYVWNLVRDI